MNGFLFKSGVYYINTLLKSFNHNSTVNDHIYTRKNWSLQRQIEADLTILGRTTLVTQINFIKCHIYMIGF